MPKKKKEKSKKFTFSMPPKLERIWDRLLALPEFVSNADLLRAMIRDFGKKYKVI